jgi:Helix-turn-helix domain
VRDASTVYLTPPVIARRLGVKADVVLSWIHSQELRSFNAAAKRGRRPRWRVSEDDLQSFLSSRSASPCPRPTRRAARQRTDATVIEFY